MLYAAILSFTLIVVNACAGTIYYDIHTNEAVPYDPTYGRWVTKLPDEVNDDMYLRIDHNNMQIMKKKHGLVYQLSRSLKGKEQFLETDEFWYEGFPAILILAKYGDNKKAMIKKIKEAVKEVKKGSFEGLQNHLDHKARLLSHELPRSEGYVILVKNEMNIYPFTRRFGMKFTKPVRSLRIRSASFKMRLANINGVNHLSWRIGVKSRKKSHVRVALIPLHGEFDESVWHKESISIPVEKEAPFMVILAVSKERFWENHNINSLIKTARAVYTNYKATEPTKPGESKILETMKKLIEELEKHIDNFKIAIIRNKDDPMGESEVWKPHPAKQQASSNIVLPKAAIQSTVQSPPVKAANAPQLDNQLEDYTIENAVIEEYTSEIQPTVHEPLPQGPTLQAQPNMQNPVENVPSVPPQQQVSKRQSQVSVPPQPKPQKLLSVPTSTTSG